MRGKSGVVKIKDMSVTALKAYNKAKQDRHRAAYAAKGLCGWCGTRQVRPGKPSCLECFAVRRERLRSERVARIARGICTVCNVNPLVSGSSCYCSACRTKARERCNGYSSRKHQEMLAAGICTQCWNQKAATNQRYCEDCLIAHRVRKFNHMGLTKESFLGMGKACWICKKEVRLDVDHDHDAHVIRGLLCRRCNMGLGYFGDDAELLVAASRYLNTTKPSKARLSLVS